MLTRHPVFQQYYKMNTNIRERRFAAGDTIFSFQHVIKDVKVCNYIFSYISINSKIIKQQK